MVLQIKRGGESLPNRVMYYGVPGSGKTTFGAFAPKPLFILTPGETGLLTLANYGLVPEADFVQADTWDDLIQFVDSLYAGESDHRTIVIDTINGVEGLCFGKVCRSTFGGSMAAFLDYGKGPDIAAKTEWPKLFAALDRVRNRRKMGVILLAHSSIKRAKNPAGAEYDTFAPLVHDKLNEPLKQWADITIFARRGVSTRKDGMRQKADSLEQLRLHFTQGENFEAKNRVGLPPSVDVPENDPAGVFGTFAAEMKDARDRSKKPAASVDNASVEPKTGDGK